MRLPYFLQGESATCAGPMSLSNLSPNYTADLIGSKKCRASRDLQGSHPVQPPACGRINLTQWRSAFCPCRLEEGHGPRPQAGLGPSPPCSPDLVHGAALSGLQGSLQVYKSGSTGAAIYTAITPPPPNARTRGERHGPGYVVLWLDLAPEPGAEHPWSNLLAQL